MRTLDEQLKSATANLHAVTHNAVVNLGSERGRRKLGDLVRALNLYYRVEGRHKLQALVDRGVIDGPIRACPPECEVRPGGTFHAKGCENDLNHPVYRARQDAVRQQLPEHERWAASVSLVGGDDEVQAEQDRMRVAMVRGAIKASHSTASERER